MNVSTAGSDEELARRVAGGSRIAFEVLVERYGGAVLAVLEKRLGDHHAALDLAQESWVRVFGLCQVSAPTRAFGRGCSASC